MAKYITLEGLGSFLTKLKAKANLEIFGKSIWDTDKSIDINTNCFLLTEDTETGVSNLSIKTYSGGGLKIQNTGLSINPNNKLAVGPTLTTELNPVEIGTQITNFDFTMEPHQLTYIDLYEHTFAYDETEDVCENLNSITLLGFDNEVGALSSFDHTTQYFLQIKLGTKSCDFKTYTSNNTKDKPKIYWADGLILGSLDANSVYEVVFTRQLQDSTHLTAAWTKFK